MITVSCLPLAGYAFLREIEVNDRLWYNQGQLQKRHIMTPTSLTASIGDLRLAHCFVPIRPVVDLEHLLSKNQDGTYTVAKADITDEQLVSLANCCGITITKVTSGLSYISPQVLMGFLKVHGGSIEEFSLKNNQNVSPEDFSEICSFMPNLKSISLVYQHSLTDNAVIAGLNSCPALESVNLNTNQLLTSNLFHMLLGRNTHFREVKFSDHNSKFKRARVTPLLRAKVEKLVLSGSGAMNNLEVIKKIESLKVLELRGTTVTAAQIVSLLGMDSIENVIVYDASQDYMVRHGRMKYELRRSIPKCYRVKIMVSGNQLTLTKSQ
ncbi:MAG: hypothetical protein S4CHLAM37_02430 [Chlamydiia bacterium]|nr:hypothetical protein [Chlamydiia bacterium]